MSVLITADDYGLHESVNRGIERLAAAGHVDAVSVMAHRDADWSSLEALRRTGVPLGAHLVLVQERPLTSGALLGALLQGGCLPRSYRPLFRAVLRRPALAQALAEEAAAQLERLREAGVPVSFVNSHEHVHLFPPIWSALHRLLDQAGWRVRAVPRARWSPTVKELGLDLSGALSWRRAPLRRATAVRPLGVEQAGRMTGAAAAALSLRSAGEVTPRELVMHPGLDSPGLASRYGHWRYRWGAELAALERGDIRRALQATKEAS